MPCRTFGNATTRSPTSFPRSIRRRLHLYSTRDRRLRSATAPACKPSTERSFYLNGVAIAGQNGTPRGLVKNDFKTYQPRVGFSYDLTGNGKTVVRGGFGTFFERMQGNDIYDIAGARSFRKHAVGHQRRTQQPQLQLASGGAASTPHVHAGCRTSESTYYPAPGVAQYSLGVQHELAPALILVTQYVGNIAWHQNTFLPINNYPLSTSMATRQAAASRYALNRR